MKMKKNILPILTVILSGVIFSACNKTTNQAAVTNEAMPVVKKEQQKDGDSFTGNIKDLMGFNKTQKCSWVEPEKGEGVVYVSGNKTRSEIKVMATADQSAQQMFNISDGEWTYSWNPATKKGMKTKIEEMNEEDGVEMEELEPTDIGEEGNDYQEINNQDYEFKCENWKADAKMFIPPTDVEFVDMNEMMGQIRQNTQDMSKICEMLSGEEKAECLKGFEK